MTYAGLVALARIKDLVRRSPQPDEFAGSRVCNICGSTRFLDFGGRASAQCAGCTSLERHRVCFEVYRREGLLAPAGTERRVLQFAPELITHNLLGDVTGTTYICSDRR